LAAKNVFNIVTFKDWNRITWAFLIGYGVVMLQVVSVRAVKFVDDDAFLQIQFWRKGAGLTTVGSCFKLARVGVSLCIKNVIVMFGVCLCINVLWSLGAVDRLNLIYAFLPRHPIICPMTVATLFQSKFSRGSDVVLPFPISSVCLFWRPCLAAYIFVVFPSLLWFLQESVLASSSYTRCDHST